MKKIHTDKAPKVIGPYSQAVHHHHFVFTSGQIPLNPETGVLVTDNFKAEVLQVLSNLDAVLTASGSSLKKVAKLTVFLTDLSNFSELNEVFNTYFDEHLPARSAVQVSALPMNARVEIEAVGTI
ncbi:MAG: RidA family protein [Candidatus Marinimicrobia bacterium]|nr:RidA family protein [Candidatus Neomarinimicrobiota bacterium]MBT6871356.1 RidA family protein [Candidatus Neomarinimicrobiota bacterium]MBT7377882.1 RidA family protein [Candidatus Neomarinimicrobiota bacterium]